MKEGGKRVLIIPPELASSDAGKSSLLSLHLVGEVDIVTTKSINLSRYKGSKIDVIFRICHRESQWVQSSIANASNW